MAVYETGTATSPLDLLSKLRTFALANGWSENNYSARTTGTGQALQINKGGNFVTFRTDISVVTGNNPTPYIGVYGHTSYSAGNTESQPGTSDVAGTFQMWANGLPGPYQAYHFISGTELGGEFLHIIVEVTAGTFKHFGTGSIVKLGAITSGQWVHVSNWHYNATYIDNPLNGQHAWPFDGSSYSLAQSGGMRLRADADAASPRWLDAGNDSASAWNNRHMAAGPRNIWTSNVPGVVRNLYQYAASALTGRNVLSPAYLMGERIGGLWNMLGYVPGVRWCNITNLSPNDVLTIGADQWKVFPVIRKNGIAGQVNSGVYGLAYKVN
jgi:hypothetical protein